MPRRVILNREIHKRSRSLGLLATWFIETFVQHGRGDVVGQPVEYGDEYAGFIVDCYALDKSGRRLYDSAFFSRPKGADKSGLAAALVLLEAFGPCRFAGWAKGGESYTFLGQTYTYSPGEPMGRPVTQPIIRILATEEGQTGNVYDSVYYNLTNDDAPLNALVKGYGVDAGLTRVKLPDGGSITPLSSGAASKDGGLETFVVFDESHLYNNPRLREMHKTVKQNLGKRKGIAEPWYIETTTMYKPGEESVAEETYDLADLIEEGRTRRARLLFDHRWGELGEEMQQDGESEEQYEARIYAAFEDAYGETAYYNSIDAKVDYFFDPRNRMEDIKRYFLNAITEADDAWLKLAEWNQIGLKARLQASIKTGLKFLWRPFVAGEKITLGFDGSLNNDATALIACRVSDGYVWPVIIEEAPDSEDAKDWSVDKQKVDKHVRLAFKKFDVVGFFADPPYWQDELDSWDKDFGDGLKVRVSKERPIHFSTSNHRVQAMAVERARTAILGGNVIHGNDPQLTRHIRNARRWEKSTGDVIGKDKPKSKKKMDAAVAMVLALEARARYLAKEQPTEKQFIPFNPRGSGSRRRR